MQIVRPAGLFQRVDLVETRLCVRLNRAARRPAVAGLFAAVSRLGDGVFWYLLMLLLPVLYGRAGGAVAVQMLAAGLIGLLLYKTLKARLVRERPYLSIAAVTAAAAPLDRYSFPSGHTLHAVAFTAIACRHFPELAALLVPFTVLVALSRVILGLHYPSDVAVGALIGGTLALLSELLLLTYWS